MIEWKPYGNTRETQPPSHTPHIITNGKFTIIGIHQIDKDRVYKWFTSNGQPISGVSHYAEINLPE